MEESTLRWPTDKEREEMEEECEDMEEILLLLYSPAAVNVTLRADLALA